jgi:hypothetical protein
MKPVPHPTTTTTELILAHARDCLRRSAEPDDVWMSRARRIAALKGDDLPLDAEQDLKDGVYTMEFSALIQRCRREGRIVLQ